MQQDFPDAEKEQDLRGGVAFLAFYNKSFQTTSKQFDLPRAHHPASIIVNILQMFKINLRSSLLTFPAPGRKYEHASSHIALFRFILLHLYMVMDVGTGDVT